MEGGYEAYRLADRVFDDAPAPAREHDTDFEPARWPVLDSWTRHDVDDWLVHQPNGLKLSRAHSPGNATRDPIMAAHVRRLGWHALTYRGHVAFPGDQLMRLSMDVASGTAGVILALGAASGTGSARRCARAASSSCGSGARPSHKHGGEDVTPEQHEQQRRWVTQSLLAETQREHHHDIYARRRPRVAPDAQRPADAHAAARH